VHDVVEVRRVFDVAAVDVECVAELFGPRSAIGLHGVDVHVYRVRQTVYHVVELCNDNRQTESVRLI